MLFQIIREGAANLATRKLFPKSKANKVKNMVSYMKTLKIVAFLCELLIFSSLAKWFWEKETVVLNTCCSDNNLSCEFNNGTMRNLSKHGYEFGFNNVPTGFETRCLKDAKSEQVNNTNLMRVSNSIRVRVVS